MLEIKHLRLLDALHRLGSMSAAARELGYSQSAVTQQVQLLERTLRTPVLTRSRRGVRLTSAGEVLVGHAQTVLATMRRAESEVGAVAGLRAGRVRIACFPSAAATIVPKALGAMRREHEGVSFTLAESESAGSLAALRRGDCDIAVVWRWVWSGGDPRAPELMPDEIPAELVEESVHVAMPSSHAAADQRWVELAQLRDSDWIAGCPECRGSLLEACERSGFEPGIAFETDDYNALQGLAAEGLGVALVPDLMLVAARHEPQLVLKRLSPAVSRVVTAVSTRSLLGVPAVRETLGRLRAAASAVELLAVP